MTNSAIEIRGQIATRLAAAGLDLGLVDTLIDLALVEDLAGGVDVTTVATVPAQQRSRLSLVARAPGVIAGVDVAALVFATVADRMAAEQLAVPQLVLEVVSPDGAQVEPGDTVLIAESLTSVLLTAERTALNFLGHLSGVATATNEWAKLLAGSNTVVRDTRKTTPGYRVLEKYAVRCGGGENHRMCLSDAALVKDNHVLAAGGVAQAFAKVREQFPSIPLEIEVDNFEQLREALAAGANVVMVDNFSIDQMKQAASLVAEFNASNSAGQLSGVAAASSTEPGGVKPSGVEPGEVKLEASGGLTLADAPALATTGVDYVAIGALTHSARVLDIGADLQAIARLEP